MENKNLQVISNGYGKTDFKVLIKREGHEFVELEVDLYFEGDFEDVYLHGDNSLILPTDTMRQHAYVLIQTQGYRDPSEFALVLIEQILHAMPAAKLGNAVTREQFWTREKGSVSGSLIRRKSPFETHVRCDVNGIRNFGAGCEINIMRSSGSSFSGFLRDGLTRQSDSPDRILAGRLEAAWDYVSQPTDSNYLHKAVRRDLIELFSTVNSRSAQENLYHVASQLLSEKQELREISLTFHSTPVGVVESARGEESDDRSMYSIIVSPIGISEVSLKRIV